MTPETEWTAEAVFGTRSVPCDLREWAADSDRQFVRTHYSLAVANPRATGPRLTALEALDQYGWETLSLLAEHRSTPLIEKDDEPFVAIAAAAAQMGLDLTLLQEKAGWTQDDRDKFATRQQVDFRKLDALAALLGMQPKILGRRRQTDDNRMGARLRTLVDEKSLTLTSNLVAFIAESVRVASDFYDLRRHYVHAVKLRAHDENLRNPLDIRELAAERRANRAWINGSECAKLLRSKLKLQPNDPIKSVARLIEFTLDALLIQVDVSDHFTGCAIQRGADRAIVINVPKSGSVPVIERSAMAHELGHYLMDQEDELNNVRVDQDRIFDNNINEKDYVESRANAFAAELLAPESEVARMYDSMAKTDRAIENIMNYFGVSSSIVRWHLSRAGFGNFEDMKHRSLQEGAWAKWQAQEKQVAGRMRAITGLDAVRQNKMGLLACKLYNTGNITRDSLESFLGYPKRDVAAICEDVLKIGFLNGLYVVDSQVR